MVRKKLPTKEKDDTFKLPVMWDVERQPKNECGANGHHVLLVSFCFTANSIERRFNEGHAEAN